MGAQKDYDGSFFSASTPDTVRGNLTEIEFMEKDSKRFADSNGWGFGVFEEVSDERGSGGPAARRGATRKSTGREKD